MTLTPDTLELVIAAVSASVKEEGSSKTSLSFQFGLVRALSNRQKEISAGERVKHDERLVSTTCRGMSCIDPPTAMTTPHWMVFTVSLPNIGQDFETTHCSIDEGCRLQRTLKRATTPCSCILHEASKSSTGTGYQWMLCLLPGRYVLYLACRWVVSNRRCSVAIEFSGDHHCVRCVRTDALNS